MLDNTFKGCCNWLQGSYHPQSQRTLRRNFQYLSDFVVEGVGRWQGQWLRQGQGGLTAWWDGEFSLNGSWALGAT